MMTTISTILIALQLLLNNVY